MAQESASDADTVVPPGDISDAPTLLEGDPEGSGDEPEHGEDEPRVGAVIGRYVVLEEIGAGAMGRVYAAYDPTLDRKVALKLLRLDGLPPKLRERGPQRLVREARSLAKLGHPNVVGVHDVHQHEGLIAVAMAHIDGVTLTEWLAEEERSVDSILDVFEQVARGLSAAHREGLVHRDIKPDNVMLDRDGRVYVVDFGLARIAIPSTAESLDVLESGPSGSNPAPDRTIVAGTPAYMAPEQLDNHSADALSDQFSFFVSLHEALYRSRPFGGSSLPELVTNIQAGNLQPVESDPGVPGWLSEAIKTGLKVEPRERFANLDVVLDLFARSRKRSRAWVWALGGAASAAIVTGAVFASSAGDVCRKADLSGTWDPQRRASVEEGLDALELPYANFAKQKIFAALDVYANAWSEMYEDNCQATNVRGEQSTQLLDRRTACLVGRRQALRAAVDVLTDPTPKIAERALDLVQRLPAIGACGDFDALNAAVDPPPDSETRAAVEEARARLARVRVLNDAGQYDAALTLAREVTASSEAIDYDPLTAEALLWEGISLDHVGRVADAQKKTRAAVWLAEQAGHDPVVGRAAAELVFQIGNQAGGVDEALEWGKHGRAKALRLGDDLLLARLLNNRGTALQTAGRFTEALEDQKIGLEIRERLLGPQHVETFTTRSNYAISIEGTGDLEAARVQYERALEDSTTALGPTHPRTAIKMTNYSNLLAQVGEAEQGLQFAEQALAIFEEAYPPTHRYVRGALSNVAAARSSLGDREGTRRDVERYLELTRAAAPDHPDVALALFNLGALAWQDQDYALARQRLNESVSIYEKAYGPTHVDIASPLITLSELDRLEEKWDVANERLIRAAALLDEAGAGAGLESQQARLALAEVAINTRRPDDAKRWADSVLVQLDKNSGPIHRAETLFLTALAEQELGTLAPPRVEELRAAASAVTEQDDIKAQVEEWLRTDAVPTGIAKRTHRRR